MKMAELKGMTSEELLKKANTLRDEFGKLSFQHKIRPLEDTSRFKKIKKEIAQIETIFSERAVN